MVRNVSELTGKHTGEDIYILGSGKSMDYIPKDFWNNRITVGANVTYRNYPVTYCIGHHHQFMQDPIDKGFTVITSEYATCVLVSNHAGFTGPYHHADNLHGDYYIYKHLNQSYQRIQLKVFDVPDHLVAGGTIITTAINFAYRLGAKCIWLCGCDGGAIDDEINYSSYENPTNRDHFVNTQAQLREMANHVRGRGIPVMSINPFIDFGLEDHKFTHVQ
jgi:hypothetical protein